MKEPKLWYVYVVRNEKTGQVNGMRDLFFSLINTD